MSSCLSQAYSHPSPSPAGSRTVTVTLANTTPYTTGAPRAETGLTLDIPRRTHTQTQTHTPWSGVRVGAHKALHRVRGWWECWHMQAPSPARRQPLI